MIKELFPIPVYEANFIRDFNKEEVKAYKTVYKNFRENHQNLIGSEKKVLDTIPELSEIREFIQVHLNQYTFKIHGMGRKDLIHITTSWLNLTKPGMSHHHHTHPNSFISGVFYFETIPDDNILFTAPSLSHVAKFYIKENTNKYTTNQVRNSVHDGLLILFPSWLRHEVSENESEKDRISLAFNTFPSGHFGEGSVNELLLK